VIFQFAKHIKVALVSCHLLIETNPQSNLLSHLIMSIPLPGTYRLRSVKYPNQLFDLSGGNVNPGTPVVGYANNNGSQNMLVSVVFLT
jgi:hypothetical protein